MTRYQRPRGTHDILPEEQPYWDYVRTTASGLAEHMGFERIDMPTIEFTPVFAKTAAGEGTDLHKEMYSFQDHDGQYLTLRAEFTASVMRAYIENGMHVLPQPVKLYSFGPVFRHEKPQKGRYREHHQFNAEIMGEQDPLADLELLMLAQNLCTALGSTGVSFQVNSTGCPACKPGYIEKLVDYLRDRVDALAQVDRDRLEQNPLRVLDSKEPDGTFQEFLNGEVRYASLKKTFPEEAERLSKQLEKEYLKRFQAMKELAAAGAEEPEGDSAGKEDA